MLRFALLSVLLAVVCTLPIDDDSASSGVDLTTGDSIEEYLAQFPEADFSPAYKGVHFFQWGERIAGKHLADIKTQTIVTNEFHGGVSQVIFSLTMTQTTEHSRESNMALWLV